MTKIINSLQTKLIASFVVLILVIAGGSFFITFSQTKKALLESSREEMQQVIGMAATQLNAEEITAISQFQPGQDGSAAYLALTHKFQELRAQSPQITNFYIMRVEGKQVSFLLDDATEDMAQIGQVYEEPEEKVFAAQDGIQVSDDLYSDEWGSFLSGYAPIRGTDGKTVFILGADMLADTVIERENFIGQTIYLIIGAGILSAALIIGLFSVTIIRDIKKLNLAAQRISLGETAVSVEVHRKDEIGELAVSFERMVASLKIMMMINEDRPEGR